jgi:hypothetical protein
VKARIAASVVLAFGIALGGTGCSMMTYQATTEQYDASDGVSTDVGSLDIRNALIISEEGVDGYLAVTIVNTGSAPARLAVQWEAGGERTTEYIEVGAESTLALGVEGDEEASSGVNDREPLLLTDIDTPPGALLPVYFQYGDETGAEVHVPVLTDALGAYSHIAP